MSYGYTCDYETATHNFDQGGIIHVRPCSGPAQLECTHMYLNCNLFNADNLSVVNKILKVLKTLFGFTVGCSVLEDNNVSIFTIDSNCII